MLELAISFLLVLITYPLTCLYFYFRDSRRWFNYLDDRLQAAEDAVERMSSHDDVVKCPRCQEKYLKWERTYDRKEER